MLLSKSMIKKYFNPLKVRYDEDRALYYYKLQDFQGLKAVEFDFKGDKNKTLKGFFYFYGELNRERIIFFDHGITSGHRTYFKEIEMLCRHGYTVFAYDHTGCFQSEGDNVVGYAQSLNDLDHAINAVKNSEYLKGSISCVGHSWGGYAVLNIGALHPEITHIVSISGIISIEQMAKQNTPSFMKKTIKKIVDKEIADNGDYARFDARESLTKTNAKLMAIHSKDDKTIYYDYHFLPLFDKLKDRKDTIFITFEHRNHTPNSSKDGIRYLAELQKDYNKRLKDGLLSTDSLKEQFKQSHRWDKITEQDKYLWKDIYEFLDSERKSPIG